MEKKLVVSPSPHIHGRDNTSKLMRDVIIALMPAFVVSVIVYGVDSLIVTGVAVVSCVLFEYLIQKFLLHGENTIGDCSAILTGMLLGFNLPATLPPGIVVLGALIAIGVGKMSFGGLGRNLFNPALVGRVFLLLSFPAQMTTFGTPAGVNSLAASGEAADASSGPTLLTFVKETLGKAVEEGGQTTAEIADRLSYGDMLLGFKAGSLGEIGAAALLLGFVYLLYRRVISWHIPVAVLGSMFVFGGVLWLADPLHYIDPVFHILSGGALLGAIFMATDYVTSPMTRKGMLIYGAGIGLLTILIRVWGSYPEGVSFAILIMNAVVPLINKYVKPKRFGAAVIK